MTLLSWLTFSVLTLAGRVGGALNQLVIWRRRIVYRQDNKSVIGEAVDVILG